MANFTDHQGELEYTGAFGHNSDAGVPVTIERWAPEDLTPSKRRVRKEEAAHVDEIRRSIEEYGFVQPILTVGGGEIVDGHIRRPR
jgi:hypothetical protein